MPASDYPRVAIVGCGIGGITAAMELRSKLGITTMTLYDRNDGLGGVWKENTYPGCGCDVRSHFYSSAKFLNPYWTRIRAPQEEIRQYWQRIFDDEELWRYTRYNSNLLRAEWAPKSNCWRLTFEDVLTKDEFIDEADIFLAAVGAFAKPLEHPPSLPGMDQFKGQSFHSARWDHTINLSGKRVGLVGNGCSAAQILPAISADPTMTVINFVRSPQWYLPAPNLPYSETQKTLFAYIPGLMRLNRWRMILTSDLTAPLFHLKNQALRERVQRQSVGYIKSKTPAKYHEFLEPKYPLGAKRMIMDSGYLDSLNLPNVELVWNPIERVTETGLALINGESRELDVLVLANGFDMGQFLGSIEVKGLDGRLLGEVWDSQGGPQGYLGSCVSGFPNMFMLLGPNTGTGHTSIIYFIESQLRWQVQVLRRLLRTRAVYFDVKPEAEDQFNKWLQSKLKDTVWATDKTQPWYRMPSGKIHVIWPATAMHFWWLNLYPRWKDITFVGTQRASPSATTIVGLTSTAIAGMGVAWYGYQRYLK